jgi:hypothetical protein
MIVICPTCRAPSNTSERGCWVCRRTFDGSEPVIGEVPSARGPVRLADVQQREYRHDYEVHRWQRASSA